MTISGQSEFFREVRKHPENFYLIHYSCQNLNDKNEGLSPRITSIAITHYASEQTVSFSTHAVAEELHIDRSRVRSEFDQIELQLLTSFFEFVRDRRDKYWVHWNMRNLTFGFEHLEHRLAVLGARSSFVIPVERRINLNDMLSMRYGDDYAPHPKMKNLMDMNGGVHRDFLNGEEEVKAFEANEFIRMHASTLSKVGFFHLTIRRVIKGTLRTASHAWGVRLDRLFESRAAKIVSLVSAVVGIPTGIWGVLH